jgi:acetylornithine deacetylase
MMQGSDKLQVEISRIVEQTQKEIHSLLTRAIQIKSVSGSEGEFVRFLNDWALGQSFETDLWQGSEKDLLNYFDPIPKHLPLDGRPNLVIKLPGAAGSKSLLFNAHSDVVTEGCGWSLDPWSGRQIDGKIFGRGACDAKGPLIGALWAMLMAKRIGGHGTILLEVIPGEEDSVGIGTALGMARGYKADAVIVLEPTANLPRCASRAGLRFEITAHGKSVHGTAKWLGTDAIKVMRDILARLDIMEQQYGRGDNPASSFYRQYPILRPITVDTINGGRWQGMVCDLCRCGGYFELLPGDDLSEWKQRFMTDIKSVNSNNIDVQFVEEYDGHLTGPDNDFCASIESAFTASETDWPGWSGFNSGCETGFRARHDRVPIVVWGPGNIEQAHSADEFIKFEDIEIFARTVCRLLVK